MSAGDETNWSIGQSQTAHRNSSQLRITDLDMWDILHDRTQFRKQALSLRIAADHVNLVRTSHLIHPLSVVVVETTHPVLLLYHHPVWANCCLSATVKQESNKQALNDTYRKWLAWRLRIPWHPWVIILRLSTSLTAKQWPFALCVRWSKTQEGQSDCL